LKWAQMAHLRLGIVGKNHNDTGTVASRTSRLPPVFSWELASTHRKERVNDDKRQYQTFCSVRFTKINK
jgi:hypothetical protein